MKLTFLEILHIVECPIKTSELDKVPVAPSDPRKLPYVQTGLEQGSLGRSEYEAYNSSPTKPNEMELVENETLPC